MSSGKFDAYIMDVEGKLFVRPAVTWVNGGGLFRIKNLTEHDAVIEPDGEVHRKKLSVGAGQDAQIKVNATASGQYSYAVWLNLGSYAVRVSAESDPVMIVEP